MKRKQPDDDFRKGSIPSCGNSSILKGSMVPKRVKFVTFEVRGIRHPGEKMNGAKILLDFRYTKQTTLKVEGSPAKKAKTWAVNTVNFSVVDSFTKDSYREIVGGNVCLKVVEGHNPTLGENVPTFEIYKIRMPGSNEYLTEEEALKARACSEPDEDEYEEEPEY